MSGHPGSRFLLRTYRSATNPKALLEPLVGFALQLYGGGRRREGRGEGEKLPRLVDMGRYWSAATGLKSENEKQFVSKEVIGLC